MNLVDAVKSVFGKKIRTDDLLDAFGRVMEFEKVKGFSRLL